MSVPDNFKKVSHRYDQYKQTEITVFYGRGDDGAGRFLLDVNGKIAGPYQKNELESLMDALKNDLDFKNPAMFV